jgi:hypothetical protein
MGVKLLDLESDDKVASATVIPQKIPPKRRAGRPFSMNIYLDKCALNRLSYDHPKVEFARKLRPFGIVSPSVDQINPNVSFALQVYFALQIYIK